MPEEEVLIWLALGAAAQREGRALLRPVVHAFVRGVAGGVVTFPPGPRAHGLLCRRKRLDKTNRVCFVCP